MFIKGERERERERQNNECGIASGIQRIRELVELSTSATDPVSTDEQIAVVFQRGGLLRRVLRTRRA